MRDLICIRNFDNKKDFSLAEMTWQYDSKYILIYLIMMLMIFVLYFTGLVWV